MQQALQALQGLQGPLDQQAPLAPQVLLVQQDRKVSKVLLDLRDQLVLPVLQVPLVLRVLLEAKDLLVLPDQLVQQDQQDLDLLQVEQPIHS